MMDGGKKLLNCIFYQKIHSMTLDVLTTGVKCVKNDQKMIRKKFEAFPALLQWNLTLAVLWFYITAMLLRILLGF